MTEIDRNKTPIKIGTYIRLYNKHFIREKKYDFYIF